MPDVQGYLRRLGLDDPGPPSAEALAAIHRAQVERVHRKLSTAADA